MTLPLKQSISIQSFHLNFSLLFSNLLSFCLHFVQWFSIGFHLLIHLNQSYVILQSLHFAVGPMESTADREITEMQPVEMEPCETEETNSMPDSDGNQEVDFFEKKGNSCKFVMAEARSWGFNILFEMNYWLQINWGDVVRSFQYFILCTAFQIHRYHLSYYWLNKSRDKCFTDKRATKSGGCCGRYWKSICHDIQLWRDNGGAEFVSLGSHTTSHEPWSALGFSRCGNWLKRECWRLNENGGIQFYPNLIVWFFGWNPRNLGQILGAKHRQFLDSPSSTGGQIDVSSRKGHDREAVGDAIYGAKIKALVTIKDKFTTPRAVVSLRFFNCFRLLLEKAEDPSEPLLYLRALYVVNSPYSWTLACVPLCVPLFPSTFSHLFFGRA